MKITRYTVAEQAAIAWTHMQALISKKKGYSTPPSLVNLTANS